MDDLNELLISIKVLNAVIEQDPETQLLYHKICIYRPELIDIDNKGILSYHDKRYNFHPTTWEWLIEHRKYRIKERLLMNFDKIKAKKRTQLNEIFKEQTSLPNEMINIIINDWSDMTLF